MRKFLLSCTMLAAFGANVAADPFVSGGEPGWGNKMSSAQRRMSGFDDVRVARQNAHKPNTSGPEARLDTPVRVVRGYAFNVLTFRHGIHGHGGGGSGGGGASGNSGGVNINIGGSGGGNSGHSPIPPPAPPFMISQIKSEPFGVFATLKECDDARAIKIAQLDRDNLRFPHQRADAPTRITHFPDGSTATEQVPTQERLDVTFCEPGTYAPRSTNGIAKDTVTPPATPVAYPGAATPVVEDTTLEVPPGFVKHWVAPHSFSRVIPGTSDVVEVLSARDRELVFMVKPDIALPPTTNILLVNDDGEVVANLRINIPKALNGEVRQGPDGTQLYRKDNPNYVAPKEKK
jgi:hypothetical protein